MRFSPGCQCCGCGPVAVTVRRCITNTNRPLRPGATVTAYDEDDVEVGSAVSDALGIAHVPIPSAGTYTFRATFPGSTPAYTTQAVTCGGSFTIVMDQGILLSAQMCGCYFSLGATITLQRISPAGSPTVVVVPPGTDALVLIPQVLTSGQSYTFTVETGPDYVPQGTTTFTISTGDVVSCVVGKTNNISHVDFADHWCFGGNPPYCMDSIPAAVDVTIPTSTIRFGDLSGQTVSVPRLGSPDGNVYFRGDFPVTPGSGGPFSEWQDTTVWTGYRISVSVTGNGTCVVPGKSIQIIGYKASTGGTPPLCVPQSPSGTGACPVAFTSATYQFTGSTTLGSPTIYTGTTTVAE